MKTTVVMLLLLVVAGSVNAGQAEIPDQWLTVAERSNYRSTASYSETMDMLQRLAAASNDIRLADFGRSGSGRPLPLVVFSTEGRFTPEACAAAHTPVVLLQSCIHPGEMDGKVASLMLLRDHVLGLRKELPRGLTVLFIPIFNADGHERTSEYYRTEQNGPVENVGFRATAAGYDLNRDHVKATSPEMRALITLVNQWRPHLHVDNHVTNGSDHAWVLTWSYSEAPQIAPSIDRWLAKHMPVVTKATAASGHANGPYVSFVDRKNPSEGFDSWVGAPRFSTGYFALRNRPSILVELHAHRPFADRVPANRDFLAALLGEIARDPRSLLDAVASAEKRTISLGWANAEPSEVVLSWQRDPEGDTILFPGAEWWIEESVVTGGSLLRFRQGKITPVDVPWYHRSRAEKSTPRPRGYLVLPGWPQIEDRLTLHGLQVERLTTGIELEVETLRVEHPRFATTSYQGEVRVDATAKRQRAVRQVPAGALWIPADQPDFELAVQLLEPEAPDSMLRWGLLNTVFERKEYIGGETLELLVRDMLADPKLAASWKTALENDPELAEDPRARAIWWYRKTEFWDEQVGLLPFFRVMQPVDLPLAGEKYN